jgi:glutamate N-acetyltransferase/amino-acid N-acetyltransferase
MRLPEGFLLSAVGAGIKKRGLDLGLIFCEEYINCVGFFTTNANPSYSVLFSKKNINHPIKAVLVNSGNANCFTHKDGLKDTEEIAYCLASYLNIKKENILLASTGIIGKKIPKKKIIRKIPTLVKNLNNDKKAIDDFSCSILTTDKFRKISYISFPSRGGEVKIIGFAKGAGMINPEMATMLGFVLTNAKVNLSLLKRKSKDIIEETFNSISVDGCMSTNDTVFFLNSGRISLSKKETELFFKKLKNVCSELAKMIIKDAEGATKFIEITVKGAKTRREAEKAVKFIANSNLFKCTIYGKQPNWGRIISALGHAKIKVKEDILIKNTSLKKKDIKIIVDLRRGKFKSTIYTCDLTPDYVKINAGYS